MEESKVKSHDVTEIEEVKPVKKKMGAPTKYYDNLVEDLYEFFDVELYEDKEKECAGKDGPFSIIESVPNRLPTIERFCANIRIHKSTIYDWAKKYPHLSDALSICRQIQQDHLIQHSLNGGYNSNFSKFFMINNSSWKEKVEIDETKTISVNFPDKKASKL